MPNDEPQSLSQRFDLETFVQGMVGDLHALREGRISIREAQARAVLAKQVLRGVHYVVMAQKYLEGRALPAPEGGDKK